MWSLSTLPYDRGVPRAYHHGNLRATLIETAAGLARTAGPEGVVLREVARQAGVSHNAAYRHFSDRDQLLSEVAELAMTQLEQAMRDRLATVRVREAGRRARRRLREVGKAYVDFALREPGLFAVAFSTALPERTDGSDPEPADTGPYALLNQCLDEMVAAGELSPAGREGADMACWASVHGFSVLHLDGPMHESAVAQREAGLDRMLDLIDAGLTPG